MDKEPIKLIFDLIWALHNDRQYRQFARNMIGIDVDGEKSDYVACWQFYKKYKDCDFSDSDWQKIVDEASVLAKKNRVTSLMLAAMLLEFERMCRHGEES